MDFRCFPNDKQQRCVPSIIEFYCFPPISTNVDDQLNFSCCHYDTVTIVIIVIACVIITISVIIMIFIDLTFTITTGFATLQTQPDKQTLVPMNPNESHLVELSVWK